MLVTRRRVHGFMLKEVWFAGMPRDVGGCSVVQFRACASKVDAPGFKRSEFPTLTLSLDNPLEALWAGFDKKSCRYEITRAERDGVHIAVQSQAYLWFKAFNADFRRLKGLNGHLPLDYMRQYGTLFVACHEQHGALGGALFLEDEQHIRWLLGASRHEDHNPLVGAGNRALIWEAIKYAKAKGIEDFDFGGYNPALPGINFFKESFGPTKTMHYTYEKVYSPVFRLAKKVAGR